MPVISVDQDSEELTLVLTAEYAAPVQRVWRMWADPHNLERWWGPPGYPATFDRFEFAAEGECRYHMTGPTGDISRGWWRLCVIDEPHRLEFEDGFADEQGNPAHGVDFTHVKVTFEEVGDRTRMVISSAFGSVAELEQNVSMGVVEGLSAAVGQIDGLLAE